MPELDWTRLRAQMQERLVHAAEENDIDALERIFRKGEAIVGSAGGIIFRVVEAVLREPILTNELHQIHERMRGRVRFVLREISDEDWASFRTRLERHWREASQTDDIGVLELVFRAGESISNVEVAAEAMAEKVAGRKLIQPEVARRNAAIRVAIPGTAKVDPEAAYESARRAIEEAEAIARRAENTLAFRFVKPTCAYKHARNTIFKVVDQILENGELRVEAFRLEAELAAIPSVTREKMRWALHRMPIRDRIAAIRLIPLNTILMFQEGEADGGTRNLDLKATRDRRLAYDLFIRGQCDEELSATYGFSTNAVKNAVGVILETLTAKPLACKLANAYLARMESTEAMNVDEVRRRMKRLSSDRRAEILNGIPNSVWKVRGIIHLHKHLFLDYISGEWVLASLVEYYNREKGQRPAAGFTMDGGLTVRGAHSAILGILTKIADEPELRQRLRQWTCPVAERTVAAADSAEPELLEFLPAFFKRAKAETIGVAA